MSDVEITVSDAAGDEAAPEVAEAVAEAAPEVAEAQVEATEAVADAAVEIAIVEAERDITIAEIAADTQIAAIEAQTNEELEACRATISRLELEISELTATLELIRSPPEENPTNLEPPLADASAEATPVSPEAEQVAPPEEPQRKRKPLRWI